VVLRSAQEGDALMASGRAALRALHPTLLELSRELCLVPPGIAAPLLAEATRVQGLVERPELRQRLTSVGVSEEELCELGRARLALRYVEACIKNAATAAAAQPLLVEQALQVRDELVASCRFNLRGAPVAEALARVTDSDAPDELALDLRELARLVQENAPEFSRDRSIDVGLVSVRALDLANALVGVPAIRERVRGEWFELRTRIHGLLVARLRRLEEAGTYAFRGSAVAQQWVCAVRGVGAPASRPVRLRTLLAGSR
jgi:hypothetical protein